LRTFRYFFDLLANATAQALSADIRVIQRATLHTSSASVDYIYEKPSYVQAVLRDSSLATDSSFVYSIVPAHITSDTPLNVTAADLTGITPLAANTNRNNYFIFYPPVTTVSTLEIEGYAYAATLDTATVTSNYWSTQYPELLLEAIYYLLQKDFLDSTTAGNILKDLQFNVLTISNDLISQQQITRMEG
jgi:hypothetical protein